MVCVSVVEGPAIRADQSSAGDLLNREANPDTSLDADPLSAPQLVPTAGHAVGVFGLPIHKRETMRQRFKLLHFYEVPLGN